MRHCQINKTGKIWLDKKVTNTHSSHDRRQEKGNLT